MIGVSLNVTVEMPLKYGASHCRAAVSIQPPDRVLSPLPLPMARENVPAKGPTGVRAVQGVPIDSHPILPRLQRVT